MPDARPLEESMNLKLFMIECFTSICFCYFFYELIVNGIISTIFPQQGTIGGIPDPFVNVR